MKVEILCNDHKIPLVGSPIFTPVDNDYSRWSIDTSEMYCPMTDQDENHNVHSIEVVEK